MTSPGSGSNGSRYFGECVIASAPIDRPWNAPSHAMILVRPVSRVILKAASLASVPELVKNTRPVPPSEAMATSRSASATWAGVAKKFETCPSVAICPVMADSTVGWAWPSAFTASPDEQIQIATTLRIPDIAALTADEDPLGRAERLHQDLVIAVQYAAEPSSARPDRSADR